MRCTAGAEFRSVGHEQKSMLNSLVT